MFAWVGFTIGSSLGSCGDPPDSFMEIDSAMFVLHTRRLIRIATMYRSRQILFLIAAVLLCSASVLGQIGLVRVTECGLRAFPGTCTFSSTVAGNLVVVAVGVGSSATVNSMTDNAGNAYVRAGNSRSVYSSSSFLFEFWYAMNSRAGATSLTITASPSVSDGRGVIWEFSGVDRTSPLGQSAVLNSLVATTTPSGACVSTTTSGELIVGFLITSATSGIRSGNPFVSSSLLTGDGFAYFVAASPGTYAAQWDTISSSYSSGAVSFRAASGGPPPPGTPLNACDLISYGAVDSSDVQVAVNMTLGVAPCTANILGAGVCNVSVVQRVVNASLPGGQCIVGTALPHSVDSGLPARRLE